MKKNKTLLLVNNLEIINKIPKESNVTFLFPIKDFCIGLDCTFTLSQIPTTGYIYVNRLFDNSTIESFKQFLTTLPNYITGIVFDDIGVLNILLSLNLNLTKILFLNHLNCNYASINAYLTYVDSVVVSTDITESEVDEILAHSSKPLVLYTFGYINIMYSRRNLISNYNSHFKSSSPLLSVLQEKVSKEKFKIKESIYGTVIYPDKPFNGLSYRFKPNVLYNLINMTFLTNEEILEIINSTDNLENKYPYKYLSVKETITKISDLKQEESRGD